MISKNVMMSLYDLLDELQEEEEAAAAASVSTSEPTVRWRKRNIDGNKLYARPRLRTNQTVTKHQIK